MRVHPWEENRLFSWCPCKSRQAASIGCPDGRNKGPEPSDGRAFIGAKSRCKQSGPGWAEGVTVRDTAQCVLLSCWLPTRSGLQHGEVWSTCSIDCVYYVVYPIMSHLNQSCCLFWTHAMLRTAKVSALCTWLPLRDDRIWCGCC